MTSYMMRGSWHTKKVELPLHVGLLISLHVLQWRRMAVNLFLEATYTGGLALYHVVTRVRTDAKGIHWVVYGGTRKNVHQPAFVGGYLHHTAHISQSWREGENQIPTSWPVSTLFTLNDTLKPLWCNQLRRLSFRALIVWFKIANVILWSQISELVHVLKCCKSDRVQIPHSDACFGG